MTAKNTGCFVPNKLDENTSLGLLIRRLSVEFPREDAQSKLDKFQKLNRRLDESIYGSKIYHLARRLILLCKYAVRISSETNEAFAIGRAIDIVFETQTLEDPTLLKVLVFECYKDSQRDLSEGVRRRVYKAAQISNGKCYLCGIELNFEDSKHDSFCEVEHILPRSLGGGNEEHNLKPACKRCNGFKKDRISGYDLHFESLVYPFTERVKGKIEPYHEFAASLFNNTRCSMCGRQSETQGKMEQRLANKDDLWHLFNIEHICDECNIEKG